MLYINSYQSSQFSINIGEYYLDCFTLKKEILVNNIKAMPHRNAIHNIRKYDRKDGPYSNINFPHFNCLIEGM